MAETLLCVVTPHLQGYTQFRKKNSDETVKKLIKHVLWWIAEENVVFIYNLE